MISTLIDKQDNFEIIRDEIGAILLAESTNQQALATAAGKDPDLWKLRIFTERSNPFEQFLNIDPTDTDADISPIVNIWYGGSRFDAGKSNISERQASDSTFNIDLYGYALSQDTAGGGHVAGDSQSAIEVQRAVRLVRNILMSASNTYLGFNAQPRLVWQRWIGGISLFQPDINGQYVQNITGARIPLSVTFNEFSPQVESVELELLSLEVFRNEDGQLLYGADFDYTT